MEIRTKKIGNTKYSFVNESWSNSRAWGHRTVLIRNGLELEDEKIRYYNRTWEYYAFQTCMYKALETYKDRLLYRYIQDYKESNGIDRFKKGEKQKVIESFNESEDGKDIQILHDSIRDRKFD